MKHLMSLACLVGYTYLSLAQEGVGIGTNIVSNDAILEIVSLNNNKGVLIPRVTTSQRNGGWATSSGLLVYDTDVRSLYHFDGTTWHQVGSPAGTIVMWSGTTIPQGWALCNGNWYNPENNTENSVTQGGALWVRTPDLRGRFIVGYDPSSTHYDQPGNFSSGGTTAGDMGGADSVALKTSEMPNHSHTINSSSHSHSASSNSTGSHSHTLTWSNGVPLKDSGGNEPDRTNGGKAAKNGGSTDLTMGTAGSHSHTITVNSNSHTHSMQTSGGGDAHENRPPYYTLAYIMKM